MSAATDAMPPDACPRCASTVRVKSLDDWEFPCPSCGALLARAEIGRPWRPPPRRPCDGPEPRRLLWLGIVGLLCAGLPGPLTWYRARRYLVGCHEIGVRPPGTVTAGWILGMLGTVELIAVACALVMALVPYLVLKG